MKTWLILWNCALLGGSRFNISTKLKPKVGPPEGPWETTVQLLSLENTVPRASQSICLPPLGMWRCPAAIVCAYLLEWIYRRLGCDGRLIGLRRSNVVTCPAPAPDVLDCLVYPWPEHAISRPCPHGNHPLMTSMKSLQYLPPQHSRYYHPVLV